MKHAVLLALFTGSLATAQVLPPGAGRELVIENCQGCHTLDRITNKQRDQTAWAATVRRMQGHGLSASDADIQGIVAYLAAAFPAQAASATSPATSSSATTPAPPKYVTSSAEDKTATLTIIAGQGDVNGGLNFNGAANGTRTFTVPLGWTVNVKFSNAGTMPHNVVLLTGSKPPANIAAARPALSTVATKPIQQGDPAQTLTFKATRTGTYVLACGVGQHAARGQYLRLVVSATAKEATYK